MVLPDFPVVTLVQVDNEKWDFKHSYPVIYLGGVNLYSSKEVFSSLLDILQAGRQSVQGSLTMSQEESTSQSITVPS